MNIRKHVLMTHFRPSPFHALPVLLLVLLGCSGPEQAATDTAASDPPYTAVARGEVGIEHGLLSFASPIAGTVSAVAVQEGDKVHAGQVLASLDDAAVRADLDTAKAQLQQAQAQQQLLVLQQKAARLHASRENAAAAAGAGAGQVADQANQQVAQIGARLAAAQAGTAVARARLHSVSHRLAQHQLRAPIDAFVEQVHTQKGEIVSPTSGPLFVLLPEVPHIIRAELNAGYAQAIHKGSSATVVLEDDNGGEAWPAHVLRVGRTLSPSRLDEDPTSRAIERTVSCVLAFDKPARLRIGRRVLVRFLPDTDEVQ